MKISVMLVTVRMGGFDVLVNSLNEQTFPQENFEVIVVDSCYPERREFMQVRDLPSNYYHLELPHKYDYYDSAYASNYALRAASGELVVFLTDNMWAEPELLKTAWQIYTNFPGYSMCGYCDRYELPPTKENLTWENAWWSVFEPEFTKDIAKAYFADYSKRWYEERKGGVQGEPVPNSPYFELPPNLFYAGPNESIPMHVLKEINGFNEDLDGGYGCADIELGLRASIAGWKFLNFPRSINYTIGSRATRGKIPGKFKKDIRTPEQQQALTNTIINDIRTGKKSVKIEHGAWS